jgi:hypothetical protein
MILREGRLLKIIEGIFFLVKWQAMAIELLTTFEKQVI